MSFKEVDINEFMLSPVKEIGENWAVLTGNKTDGEFNSMTVSWGGVGFLWNKLCAFVFVRPQRYTYEFMENGEYFSLSLMPENSQKKIAVFGSKSGRNCDKYAESGEKTGEFNGIKYFDGASKVLICKKLAFSDMNESWFADSSLDSSYYKNKDYHRMYIGEIIKVFENN